MEEKTFTTEEVIVLLKAFHLDRMFNRSTAPPLLPNVCYAFGFIYKLKNKKKMIQETQKPQLNIPVVSGSCFTNNIFKLKNKISWQNVELLNE